jgi:hypothetical protein
MVKKQFFLLLLLTSYHLQTSGAENSNLELIRAVFPTVQRLSIEDKKYTNPLMVEEDDVISVFQEVGSFINTSEATEKELIIVKQERDCYKYALTIVTLGCLWKVWNDYNLYGYIKIPKI